MACWCTHSICYGFHIIPVGEGRNDVFSALIMHWPKAPECVVYNLACALGPYCWARESDFFIFIYLIFFCRYAVRHWWVSCSSKAVFLKNYSEVDSSLSSINTSAAECGNSGLTRIRKPVSYMTQEHAILYSWVFISVWNRCQLLKLEGRKDKLGWLLVLYSDVTYIYLLPPVV